MSEKKKRKTTFVKREDGLIYQTEDGDALAVGLPTEIESMTAGEGKGGVTWKGAHGEVKGEHYKKIVYDWNVYSPRQYTNSEAKMLFENITNVSGTIVHTAHMSTPWGTFHVCSNCYHTNPDTAKYCNNCGTEL